MSRPLEKAMMRAERERQLTTLTHSDKGRGELVKLYCKATGTPIMQMLPIGILYSQIVETILNYEFPAPATPPGETGE